MVWYYKVGDEEKGPVSKADLQSLIKSNSLNARSLVRNVEMDDWYPLIDVIRGNIATSQAPKPPAADDAFLQDMEAAETYTDKGIDGLTMEERSVGTADTTLCSQCGRSFPADQVIAFEDDLICAACKPMFVQKLREGAAIPSRLSAQVYAGFWIRGLAKLIDVSILVFALSLFILLPIYFVIIPMFASGPDGAKTAVIMGFIFISLAYLLASIAPIAYSTFCLGRWGATIGKKACGLKVVTAEGEKITYWRALGRGFAEGLSGLILCIGYILAAFDEELQTLHDRICSTRVITHKD